MKSKVFIVVGLFSILAFAQPSLVHVKRVLKPSGKVMHYTLKMGESEMTCQLEEGPLHILKIKKFKSLAPPFVNAESTDSCSDIVEWEKRKTCYKAGENAILDELFKACS